MASWYFHPFVPTKEAYERKPFSHAKNIRTLLEVIQKNSIYLRGQLQLKGAKEDYPEEFGGRNKYESEDKKILTIEYNNIMELKEFLKTIEYNEEKIERVNLYGMGFFLKMRG
jgi:hypothetical protein